MRDPKPTWARPLGMIAVLPVAVAYGVFRMWLGRTTGYYGGFPDNQPVSALVGWFLVAVLLAAALSLVRGPTWLSAGQRGVEFRSWFRVGAYRWSEIGSFELGNPEDPRFAYIILRCTRQPSWAVRLPAFETISSSELVETLRRTQHLHVG